LELNAGKLNYCWKSWMRLIYKPIHAEPNEKLNLKSTHGDIPIEIDQLQIKIRFSV